MLCFHGCCCFGSPFKDASRNARGHTTVGMHAGFKKAFNYESNEFLQFHFLLGLPCNFLCNFLCGKAFVGCNEPTSYNIEPGKCSNIHEKINARMLRRAKSDRNIFHNKAAGISEHFEYGKGFVELNTLWLVGLAREVEPTTRGHNLIFLISMVLDFVGKVPKYFDF